ncbi:MAG: hypothetical protein K8R18_15285 [Parvibaculum sp.]|uniref:NB-ARC domain-containing protein n=1 Tax=Parvibaculum sp. TaxID=2024848 RepID=UPI002600EB60|nr:NB-ARC domain-containing protein [Parvibaculum sp.]MCE9650981.1 hypothetical protein [Parvibaculum sp.]
MASYQRIALFVFFDAIERDLVTRIRSVCIATADQILTDEERIKALARLQKREAHLSPTDDYDLLHGLDIGDKYAVLLRHKNRMDQSSRDYYVKKKTSFERCIPVRNATMHGRPLTTEEYSLGFSLANEFLRNSAYWPDLQSIYRKYTDNPQLFLSSSVSLLDDELTGEVLNNLPIPDYDDTGFLPRPSLEKDLRKKILGRHPVITVLGDGGNGKTALTLQTLYGLLRSNDHSFDAIVWVSAKSTKLSVNEITRVEGAITSSLGLFEEIANTFEGGDDTPLARVRQLLEQNRILLVIDNLETVLDDTIRDFASDVPGESKIVFTSRVPLGSDLSVIVDSFSESEAIAYLKRLADAYDITTLKTDSAEKLKHYIARLGHKPLLLKWFALGVLSGLDAMKVTSNPEVALRFCMENVFTQLTTPSQKVLSVIATLPTPASAFIIQHVSQFSADEVEAALAELLRFALIERINSNAYERLYHVKPFTKAYLLRVLKAQPDDAAAILSRYRNIDTAYQSERGEELRNRYDPRVYTVRSRTEALVARRLRVATSLCLKEKFEEAFGVLDELRISSPDYFEVSRVEAFVAFRQGDIPRAALAYETAFETGKSQPQLHYFYGNFLMKSYGDYVEASRQFALALDFDPDALPVLREKTRSNFFLNDFPAAQKLLDKIYEIGFTNPKDEVVATDLQAQLHYREAEFLLTKGDPKASVAALKRLDEFLLKVKAELFDEILSEHLQKALRTIEALRRCSQGVDLELLDMLYQKISNLQPARGFVPPPSSSNAVKSSTSSQRSIGELRIEGRREGFGFLRDSDGKDTYVARASIGESLWSDICQGRRVEYDVFDDGTGKTHAMNLMLCK